MKFEVKIILLVDAETEQAAEEMLHGAAGIASIGGDIAGWWLDGIDEIFEDEETVDIQ